MVANNHTGEIMQQQMLPRCTREIALESSSMLLSDYIGAICGLARSQQANSLCHSGVGNNNGRSVPKDADSVLAATMNSPYDGISNNTE